MLLIAGITTQQKQLDYNQGMLCPLCCNFGRYEVYMETMVATLFFLPLFRWNKKFYVITTCCHSVYAISKELGTAIAKGEPVRLEEKDLHLVHRSREASCNLSAGELHCPQCGAQVQEDFKFCPQCAQPLR
ncbi:zinc ribbon domain-containing protein [Anaerotalea alkaliphila]|uniref:Zinc ribbon domain-containing protein n=1 Tax=Anaerotalea alkaliphila TaxID=2662126 RepID=A0A7X5KP69_9FIRM|nr:zinc ribbon domain-containing protein [Anaerotalea alkaliphila]NDL68774.1 zinc ribbon domain-containing protein [Anaerotalea alkaliphila]